MAHEIDHDVEHDITIADTHVRDEYDNMAVEVENRQAVGGEAERAGSTLDVDIW